MSELLDILDNLVAAAVIEAQTVPHMLLRDGRLYWRTLGGGMVALTLPPGACVIRTGPTWDSWRFS